MKSSAAKVMFFVFVVAALMIGYDVWTSVKDESAIAPVKIDATLTGLAGSEKINFLDNPQIKKLLWKRYRAKLDYSKAGSIEMVTNPPPNQDFLWPSSQVAVELYKLRGKKLAKSGVVFNTPIVFYSWDIVTDALEKQGYVEKRDGVYFVVKTRELIDLVIQKAKWKDLGLDLYGPVTIASTDPSKSNSGNMFAGLLANILNDGEVVSTENLPQTLPRVKQFFDRLGYMEHSTGVLFEQYLRTGVGAHPIIVGYENSLIEFARQHEDVWEQVRGKMRVLYPVPTVWSDHTLIAVSPKAKGLLPALEDKDIQQLAWDEHGFRTSVAGVINDPKLLGSIGIAERISQVMRMPSPQVMDAIVRTLQGEAIPQSNVIPLEPPQMNQLEQPLGR